MSRLRGLLVTHHVVDSLELVVELEHSHGLIIHHLVERSLTILSIAGIVVVSLDERLQVNLTIILYAVSSGHGDSTVTISVAAVVVTNALIEVVSANNTIVLEGISSCLRILNDVLTTELGITATDNLLRLVICQSNDVQLCRNNNCIVRSNGGVTLLELHSDEGQPSLSLTFKQTIERSTISIAPIIVYIVIPVGILMYISVTI